MATLEELKVRVGDVICVERYLRHKDGPRMVIRIEDGEYYSDAGPDTLGKECENWVLISRRKSLKEMIADVL